MLRTAASLVLYSSRPVFSGALACLALISGCTLMPPKLTGQTGNPAPTATAAAQANKPCDCSADPKPTPPTLPTAPTLILATFADLPGWEDDDLQPAFQAFVEQCNSLIKQPLWRSACTSARLPEAAQNPRRWFEANFRVWQQQSTASNPEGLVTGYYEPLLRGSRTRQGKYTVPVFGPPDDLITVELGELYPELKNMRLRGRLEGRKLVPYYSRSDWAQQEEKRKPLLWVDDALDFFFMQVQGSGQVQLSDGGRIRLGYADQNGHPYHSIGRWLIDRGELKLEQASMQGIRGWAEANPKRLPELLNANPSLVFFRELKAEGIGPPGAPGVPLTPERSIAVDPRFTPLGSPVWLATTEPNSERPLRRLMLAQDTGGAIRGPVRADFYWGSGAQPGQQAGRMKQTGRMWLLLPREHTPPASQTAP